jgi:hypothetical protein
MIKPLIKKIWAAEKTAPALKATQGRAFYPIPFTLP